MLITTDDAAAISIATQRVRNNVLVPRNAGITTIARSRREISKPVGTIEIALAWAIQFSFDEICPNPTSMGPIPYAGIVPSNIATKLTNPNVMKRFVIRPSEGCSILLTQT
jgi:hypothetical protein